MAKIRKGLNRISQNNIYSNNISDLFNNTMTSVMDVFYNKALNKSIDGHFKAVCLSGKNSGDGTGAGSGPSDATTGAFVNIIVRPLTEFGNILPDPRLFKDDGGEKITNVISMHGSIFTAQSKTQYDALNPIDFGQIVDCYFENGSIRNSNFKNLKFIQPEDKVIEVSYQQLQFIEGFRSIASSFSTNPNLLFSDTAELEARKKATEEMRCYNVKGPLNSHKYIVMHYNAGTGAARDSLSYMNLKTNWGYHYMINRDGTWFETCSPDLQVYHAAGNSMVNNWNSVGVSLMNTGYEDTKKKIFRKPNWLEGPYPNGPGTNFWEPYTKEAIDRAALIVAELCVRYDLTTDKIVRHSDIQTGKSDPGPLFDMDNFRLKVDSHIYYLKA